MMKLLFESFTGTEITDRMLEEAAQLLTDHYGVWGKHPTNPPQRAVPKSGSRVKLSKDRLRAFLLPNNATSSCSYIRVTVDDHLLAGHAFACRWGYEGANVCWVTQLVVHRDFRERGLATMLLNLLRRDHDDDDDDDDDVYGIVSSHPAACLAAGRAFGGGINTVALDFIHDHAEATMKASPIGYINKAEPRGKLFNSADASGAVSAVDTKFFVDHAEPLEALAWVRKEPSEWPLGELCDGHEFLFIVANRRRRRRSRLKSTALPI